MSGHSSFDNDIADGCAGAGRNLQIISPDSFMADLADTIRLVCKVRGKMTIGALAQRAGIAQRRLEKLIHNDPFERRQASGSELLSIWAVLGAAGASHGLAAIHMTAADNDAEPGGVRLGVAVADLFDAGADLARAAADGVIDAREAAGVDVACDRARETIDAIQATARAARGKQGGSRP
jgi:hypothetical protein